MTDAKIPSIFSGVGPIRADLGTILARSARRYGSKPAVWRLRRPLEAYRATLRAARRTDAI
jgi:hypothetical protein